MSRGTSVLRHEADDRLYDSIRAASRRHRVLPLDYIREARRMGWSFALIADAARVGPSTIRARYRAWQESC